MIPTQTNNDWKAFLFQVPTGSIGPAVNLQEGADYSLPLSDDTTAKFALDKTDLPIFDPTIDAHRNLEYWLGSWGPGIVYTFQDRAIFAGPLISNPREYAKEIQFDAGGARSILKKRFVVKESDLYSPNIAKGVIQFKGMSLGTIAQEVVKVGMAKPRGNLPINFASPRETTANDAEHQRTYRAYNVNTLTVDEVLTKISEVSRGPDIAFRPRLINDAQLVWDMVHGTENNPRIAQKVIPRWDLTAEKSDVASLEITKTGTYETDRVIVTGSGTNEATIMAMAENLDRGSSDMPLLESSYNIQSDSKSNVKKHAESTLLQHRRPLREYTLFVSTYGEYPLGTYWPGDLAIIYVKGFFNLPDGEHKMRILNMTGGFGSSQVRLSMQLDDQWEIDSKTR